MWNEMESGNTREEIISLRSTVERLTSRVFELEQLLKLKEENSSDSPTQLLDHVVNKNSGDKNVTTSEMDFKTKKRRGRPPLHGRTVKPRENVTSLETSKVLSFNMAQCSPQPVQTGGRVMKLLGKDNNEDASSDGGSYTPYISFTSEGEMEDEKEDDDQPPGLQTLPHPNCVGRPSNANRSALWKPRSLPENSLKPRMEDGIANKENVPMSALRSRSSTVMSTVSSTAGHKRSSVMASSEMTIADLVRNNSPLSKKSRDGVRDSNKENVYIHKQQHDKSDYIKPEGFDNRNRVPISVAEHCACVANTATDDQTQTLSIKVLLRLLKDDEVTISSLFDAQLHPSLVRSVVRISRRQQKGEAINDSLLYNAVKLLNNMIAGSKPRQFQSIPFGDLLPALVALMTASSRTPRVTEQAIWALDNCALDFGQCRDDALDAGAINAIFMVLQTDSSEAVILRAVKLLVTLTEGHELTVDEARGSLDAVEKLLGATFRDGLIEENACWVLVNITDDNEATSSLIHSRAAILLRLMAIIRQEVSVTPQTVLHAVTVLGRLLSVGTEAQMGRLLKVNFVSAVKVLMCDKNSEVRCKAFECVSTLCQCGPVVIQTVIDSELLKVLLNLHASPDLALRDIASRALMHACRHANAMQVRYMVDIGVLLTLCKTLHVRGKDIHAELVPEALRSLHAMLVCLLESDPAEFEDVSAILGAAGGWDSVYRLRTSKDKDIRQLATDLDENKMRLSVNRDYVK